MREAGWGPYRMLHAALHVGRRLISLALCRPKKKGMKKQKKLVLRLRPRQVDGNLGVHTIIPKFLVNMELPAVG